MTNKHTIDQFRITDKPNYLANSDEERVFAAAFRCQIPLIIKGPTGCGKTRFVEHVAYSLDLPISFRHSQAGLLHHSDRGSQYASAEYQAVLQTDEIVASMIRAGNCYNNAAMESFFGTLKCELIHDRRYRTRAEARQDIFEHIEVFHNRRRRYSSLGYLSPVSYEELCQLCLN